MTIKRLITVLVLLILSTSVHAQRFNQQKMNDAPRYKTWEVSLLMQYQTGTDAEGEQGSSIDIDSGLGWGFGIGWNWTEHWNLGYRFSLNKPDYSATIVPEDPAEPPQTINYDMSKYSHQFNVAYHFMKGPFSPYVQAGVGWTKLDSNILSRPPTTGCWWDPWWGYICSTTWDTFKTSEFTYNLGVGLRWDVNSAMFLRGAWNRQFINLDNGNLDFDTVTLEAGFMF
ncbi:porin family protein [Pseudomonadota bacterium]